MNIRTQNSRQPAPFPDEGFVSDYLLYLMAAASDAASGDFHLEVRASGLRVPEWRVLACLADHDGQMVTQLAAFALMEQSRLTKIIDHMAEKDLVTRRDDRRDRRRVRVYLTDRGRGIAERLVEEARAHERSIVERLQPGDAAHLKEILKQVMAMFGKVPATPMAAQDAEDAA